MRNAYEILIKRKDLGRRAFGIPRHRWENLYSLNFG
jgi:hypothetical protein